ncbi:hypothetical protein BDQ17DRAFT_1359637 [Cyathus striatus]|nr:hypothetical protein BDQ17DRAFT_1359637 [Cyathus striatus]
MWYQRLNWQLAIGSILATTIRLQALNVSPYFYPQRCVSSRIQRRPSTLADVPYNSESIILDVARARECFNARSIQDVAT